MHRIPGLREPEGIYAGGPPHVDHRRGRPPGMTLDQLAGPQPLEGKRALLESVFLGRLMVVLGNGSGRVQEASC